ncbi:MAG: SAM-dependent methyltransferase, partial [Clostridia bacterium]|nr:SAM-dependent methyltransferase [Clostridia bacterium]
QKGGIALIAVPGIREEFTGRSEELLTPWLGEEAYMFKSPSDWKRIIGTHENIAEVRTWQLSGFDLPWQEWFDTKHEYALNDRSFFDSLIRPYTNFVGIMVKKK